MGFIVTTNNPLMQERAKAKKARQKARQKALQKQQSEGNAEENPPDVSLGATGATPKVSFV